MRPWPLPNFIMSNTHPSCGHGILLTHHETTPCSARTRSCWIHICQVRKQLQHARLRSRQDLAVRGPEGAHQRPSTTDLWNASCPALSYGWSQTLSSSQPTPPLGLAPPLVSRAGANGLPQSKSLKFDHSNSDTAAARAVLLSELQKEN